jgi:hypothetical protein
MDDSFFEKVTALRDEAFAKVRALPEFVAYMALDEAVKTMRGVALPQATAASAIVDALIARKRANVGAAFAGGLAQPRRLSQSDAAELALREANRPMATPELADAIVKMGATVGGNDPLINVASSLSRDKRFKSVRIDGKSMWHLVALPVEHTEDEAAELDLALESAAHRALLNQEGGGPIASTT